MVIVHNHLVFGKAKPVIFLGFLKLTFLSCVMHYSHLSFVPGMFLSTVCHVLYHYYVQGVLVQEKITSMGYTVWSVLSYTDLNLVDHMLGLKYI